MPLLYSLRVARCCHLQGVPREGCGRHEGRGRTLGWGGWGAAGFSTFQWEAGIQEGAEKGLEDLHLVSGELQVSKGTGKKCSWVERTCAASSHLGAMSSMQLLSRGSPWML